MSAFLVTDNHINFIVNFTRSAFREQIAIYYAEAFEDAAKVGATLYEANVRSVDYRYPQDASGDPEAFTELHYRYKPAPTEPATVENIAKLFKALDCLEYQSCEFPTWKESEAYRLCRTIRSMAINELPGYEHAPWGIK